MATRTIFFHIGPLQQVVFYLLATVSVGVCGWGVWRRVRLWRAGAPSEVAHPWRERLSSLLRQAVAQRRTRRRRYAGRMHVLLSYGFVVLFIGTCIVAVEHYGAFFFGHHWFYRGVFYLVCKVVLDLFGLGLLVSVVMALTRRCLARPRALGHTWGDTAFLLLLLAATATGFLLEAGGIAADPNRHPYAAFSPVASLLLPVVRGTGAAAYIALWWVHAPLVLGVIAALPYGRWLHLFVAPLAIAYRPARPMGVLAPVRMEDVEATGRIGAGVVTDLTRWQLLSLDACMECGRCTEACPANAVGKELNPKGIVLDLRRALADGGTTGVVSDASLWACTNCHACVRECPVLIRHVDIIEGIRRYRVAEGRLSGTPATTLRQIAGQENPWGLPRSQRMNWAHGLEVPLAAEGDGREVLFWVGCAGAFDPRAQRTSRAVATLLNRAGVRFAVLGERESCTGDPARRIGDEFLFQRLAEANIETLQSLGARTIVTQCAHCFHTLRNEYPAFGGSFEVLHHTQYLARLVAEGRLAVPGPIGGTVAYHDPCFLARVNGETESPRALLNSATGGGLRDPGRSRERTLCCGAGGGRMWMEEPPQQRPGIARAKELLATGANAVAVGCPFCKVMLSDSLLQVAGEEVPRVMDVAEIMAAALGEEVTGAPVPRGTQAP